MRSSAQKKQCVRACLFALSLAHNKPPPFKRGKVDSHFLMSERLKGYRTCTLCGCADVCVRVRVWVGVRVCAGVWVCVWRECVRMGVWASVWSCALHVHCANCSYFTKLGWLDVSNIFSNAKIPLWTILTWFGLRSPLNINNCYYRMKLKVEKMWHIWNVCIFVRNAYVCMHEVDISCVCAYVLQ